MSTNSFTYRLLSAFVLMLFMSTIVVPSSISAASLFCDMEMTEMHTGTYNCCDIDEMDGADHHRKMATDEQCHSEKICLHVLTPDRAQPEAVVSLNGNKLLALPVTHVTINPTGNRETAGQTDLFAAVPNDSPPIFLLNNTFLN